MLKIDVLKTQRTSIEATISGHISNSARVHSANQIIEASRDLSKEEIDTKLSEADLPSLVELGKITLSGLMDLSMLHRKLRKLKKKISQLENIG